MSEDNSNLGDDIKKGAEDAMDSAKEAAQKASEKAGEFADDAKEFAEDAKEAVSDFAEDAKETAQEFVDDAKEILNQENKKLVAGILAILIGSFGIHKFYLGYNKEGIFQILLSFLCGLGGLIALIEGIIYLTKSDEEFYQTYQVGKKPWF